MKVLYVTTVAQTMNFFKGFIDMLLKNGHVVDIATCETEHNKVPDCYRAWGSKVHQISTSRSPLNKGNLKAIKQIRQIVENGGYDLVHCHTPIAAVCTRIACRSFRSRGTKVIYTAHGFHFYKGAPLKNWMLYYPAEKICAHFTDVLITINQEDYDLAKRKLKAKCVEYVPGVGVDVDKFSNASVDKESKRKEIGVPNGAFFMVSVGELNRNKNHETVIKALAALQNENVHYGIAGKGDLYDYLLTLASDLGIEKQVHFLGYRNDIAELYQCADLCVFPSIREGLGLAAIEGMAVGLPLIVSDNRGTRSYAIDGCNAVVCSLEDGASAYTGAINKLLHNPDIRKSMSDYNREKVREFDIRQINQMMMRIYSEATN